MKALHRLIVTSATYRQASRAPARLCGPRPGEPPAGTRAAVPALRPRWCATTPWRSRARWSSGIGGPSIKPYQPAGLWEELAGGAGEGPYVQDKGPKLYGRSLYVYRKRTVPHPAMATFDAPSREICQVKRTAHQHAASGPRALERRDLRRGRATAWRSSRSNRAATPPEERIAFAFRRALAHDADAARAGRPATRARAVSQGLSQADQDAALKLIRHGESPPDPEARRGRAGRLYGDRQRHPQPRRDDHARMK